MFSKYMKLGAMIAGILFCGFALLHNNLSSGFIYSLTVTFGTFFYHLAMRLLVGYTFDRVMKNKADLGKKHYRLAPFEQKLYRKLNVKRWKAGMPTYDPELFDPQKHSYEEIAMAMCQAELVHEAIIVLSFVPLLFSLFAGSFSVFLATSVLSAMFDGMFVIMQRFNRPRIIALINKKRK